MTLFRTSAPHEDTQRNAKRVSDHQQVIELRRRDARFDPHHGHPIQIGALGKTLLRQARVLSGLSDLHPDHPAARKHPLGDRISRHPINALGTKIKSL